MNTHFNNRLLVTIVISALITLLALFSCTNYTESTTVSYPYPPPTETLWSSKNIFTDASQKITVNNGDKFIIGFVIEHDLYPIIKEVYDSNKVDYIDKKIVMDDEIPAYCWFLFKAIRLGETQITIKHILQFILVQNRFSG